MERLVLTNCSQVLTADGAGLGILANPTIVVESGSIAWIGPASEAPAEAKEGRQIDLGGRFVSPGLVDCHAHPVFAGQRSEEFARRARGDHYLDIAREGGGIMATVRATREASREELVRGTERRLRHALQSGTTTMEAKSGYDLRPEGELRLLEVASAVSQSQPIALYPTLLGAHALPPEYADDRAGFVEMIASILVARVAETQAACAVDVYCDEGAFTLDETRTILSAAKAAGLKTKAHIGQFADLGAAELLAELGSLSGDHLEQVSESGIAAMAAAGVVATMLPGACVQLRMTPPPIEAFRAAGVRMALGSDLNPGTSNSANLPLAMWLATTHLGMTVEEAWLGVTRHAAAALGDASVGVLKAGAKADLVVWDAELASEIPYHFGSNLVHSVFKAGEHVLGPAKYS